MNVKLAGVNRDFLCGFIFGRASSALVFICDGGSVDDLIGEELTCSVFFQYGVAGLFDGVADFEIAAV